MLSVLYVVHEIMSLRFSYKGTARIFILCTQLIISLAYKLCIKDWPVLSFFLYIIRLRSPDRTAIVEFLVYMYAASRRYCCCVRIMGHKGNMKWDILSKETDINNA